jgi:hypothetical protein
MTRSDAGANGKGRAPKRDRAANRVRHGGVLVYDDSAAPPRHVLTLGDDPAMLVAALTPDGDLVHVSEDAAKTRADLLCPSCETAVIAVKGPIRAHHFRHRSRAACVAGTETALHLLAKRVLAENPRLDAPPIVARCGRREEVLRPAFRMTLTNVRLEAREPGVVPDLAAEAEGASVFIEVVVTHRVDDAKRAKLAARGVSTLEIDLSRLPCGAAYPRVASAIRREAPRRWVYSRRAEARADEMRRQADAAAARRTARIDSAAAAAVEAFAAAPEDDAASVDAALAQRLERLGIEELAIGDAGAGSPFRVDTAVWRGAVIACFLLAPCDDVAAHGAVAFRPGQGYGGWESYPVARFSIADVAAHLAKAKLAKPALLRLDAVVAERAGALLPDFRTPDQAIEELIDAALAAGVVVDGADWGGGRSLSASDDLVGRVWREAALRRAAEAIDPALHAGEIDPGRVGRWLTDVAGSEIRGAHAGDRLLPRLSALADLVRVFERSGAARRGAAPPEIRDQARKLGFDTGKIEER